MSRGALLFVCMHACMQVMQVFQVAQEAFPDAEVKASTFEAFVDRLAPFTSVTGTLTCLLVTFMLYASPLLLLLPWYGFPFLPCYLPCSEGPPQR